MSEQSGSDTERSECPGCGEEGTTEGAKRTPPGYLNCLNFSCRVAVFKIRPDARKSGNSGGGSV